jgi:hypothetical protein
MLLSTVASAASLGIGWYGHGIYAETKDFPFHIQPMYAGLAISGVIYLFGHLYQITHRSRSPQEP